MGVRTPQIADIETAVRIYYEKIELSSKDIQELFPGAKGASTITRLKGKARERMAEEGALVYNSRCVNTEVAFRAWGLDIEDLEKRLAKLRRLKLHKEGA